MSNTIEAVLPLIRKLVKRAWYSGLFRYKGWELEDLEQEVLLRLHHYTKNFKEELGNWPTFIYHSTRLAIYDVSHKDNSLIRTPKRKYRKVRVDIGPNHYIDYKREDPYEKELSDKSLISALNSLEEGTRNLIKEYIGLDQDRSLSIPEIAEKHGIKFETAKKRIYRGLNKIRNHLS